MRTVVDGLESSYRDFPREIIVIYVKPTVKKVFSENPSWSIIQDSTRYLIAKIECEAASLESSED